MANILGDIIVRLLANRTSFEDGMNKATKQAKASGKEIEGVFEELGGSIGKLLEPLGAIGGQFEAAISGVGSAAKGLLETFGPLGSAFGAAGLAAGGFADVGVAAGAAALGVALHGSEAAARLHELSEATGVSVEDLFLLGDVASTKGISVDSMAKALEKMSKAALQAAQAGPSAKNAFKDLGIEVTNADGSLKNAKDLFDEVSAKFATIPDGPLKTAEAMKIFGRSGPRSCVHLLVMCLRIDGNKVGGREY